MGGWLNSSPRRALFNRPWCIRCCCTLDCRTYTTARRSRCPAWIFEGVNGSTTRAAGSTGSTAVAAIMPHLLSRRTGLHDLAHYHLRQRQQRPPPCRFGQGIPELLQWNSPRHRARPGWGGTAPSVAWDRRLLLRPRPAAAATTPSAPATPPHPL